MKHTALTVASTLFLALACGGESSPTVTAAAAPDPSPSTVLKSVQDGGPDFPPSVGAPHTPIAPPRTPAFPTQGLCKAGERTRMSCDVKGNKTLSVCEVGGALHYRFGTPIKLELELPKAGSEADVTVSKRRPGEDREIVVYGFWNDGHRYAAEVVRTEDQFEGRVIVRKGSKKLTSVVCVGDVSGDLTELNTVKAGDLKRPWAMIGTWTAGENAINIDAQGDGLQITEAEAIWIGANPGQVHTGEAAGPLQQSGTFLRYSQDGCEMTLTPTGPDSMTVTDNLGCGGMNVTFEGEYHRIP